jgi:hypothetical protein
MTHLPCSIAILTFPFVERLFLHFFKFLMEDDESDKNGEIATSDKE